MNSAEVELYEAVGQVRGGRAVIRSLCLVCGEYLGGWDVRAGWAVCWKCREVLFPAPKVEVENPGPKAATLVRLRDGKYAVLLE